MGRFLRGGTDGVIAEDREKAKGAAGYGVAPPTSNHWRIRALPGLSLMGKRPAGAGNMSPSLNAWPTSAARRHIVTRGLSEARWLPVHP
jgi:hypothetical protein